MKKMVPQSVSFEVPLGPIEDSKLHDAEAEAVIKFAEEEQKAEEEQHAMAPNDPIKVQAQLQQQQQPTVFDDDDDDDDNDDVSKEAVVVHTPVPVVDQGGSSSSAMAIDPGLMVPVTPPRYDGGESPRGSPVVRSSDGGGDGDESKRARVEEAKKQRVQRLRMEYEQRISAVQIAYKGYFTMDDYSTELDMEEPLDEDLWAGEDEVQFVSGVPEALWSDHQIDLTPTQAPEAWVDELADKVEIERLWSMGVLVMQMSLQVRYMESSPRSLSEIGVGNHMAIHRIYAG